MKNQRLISCCESLPKKKKKSRKQVTGLGWAVTDTHRAPSSPKKRSPGKYTENRGPKSAKWFSGWSLVTWTWSLEFTWWMEKNRPLQVIPWPPHTHTPWHACTCTHTERQTDRQKWSGAHFYFIHEQIMRSWLACAHPHAKAKANLLWREHDIN